MFVSASLDNTIRIFSLDRFTELYCLQLPAGSGKINLLDENSFACLSGTSVQLGRIYHLALSFFTSNIPVKRIQKMYKSVLQRDRCQADFVMTLFADNSIQI